MGNELSNILPKPSHARNKPHHTDPSNLLKHTRQCIQIVMAFQPLWLSSWYGEGTIPSPYPHPTPHALDLPILSHVCRLYQPIERSKYQSILQYVYKALTLQAMWTLYCHGVRGLHCPAWRMAPTCFISSSSTSSTWTGRMCSICPSWMWWDIMSINQVRELLIQETMRDFNNWKV